MTIAFFSNVLNIHQVHIADNLYELTSHNYWFIAFEPLTEETLKGGTADLYFRPYLIKAYESQEAWNKALDIAKSVDVMIYGQAPIYFLSERLKLRKLSFQCGERWLKRGLLNFLSPRLLKEQWYYHTKFTHKPLYCLCSSAYAASDYELMHAYVNRCFKWGYFTAVPNFDIETVLQSKRNNSTIKILWVSRFIKWKHPEQMISLAKQLPNSEKKIIIDMIGGGPLYSKIDAQINESKLSEHVHLLGSMPNNRVIEEMRIHDIFCFTSDKREGWGTVLNEAMSNGCCPVSSVEAGSTPYLINDAVNGFSFDLRKKDDLFVKVLELINNPEKMYNMSIEAYNTMHNVWNPKNASFQLYNLFQALLNNRTFKMESGPCSPALSKRED